jgi:hypothetical protein
MSEPTTTAVPQSEDKPAEVTLAVEPSPEIKVETSAPVPDEPKEDIKAGEPAKTETPPVTEDTAQPATTPATDPKEAKGADVPNEAPKEHRPKSPSIFTRLLNLTAKAGEKFPRPKRKEKMPKEETPVSAAEDPVVAAEEPSPDGVKPEDKPVTELNEVIPADPVTEIVEAPAPVEPEAPVPQTTSEEVQPKDEGGDAKPSKSRVNRRLSSRITSLFTTPHKRRAEPPAKLNEAPPKIDEPTPVAPLENPAADSTPDADQPKRDEEVNEPPKIIDATPSPVVATA